VFSAGGWEWQAFLWAVVKKSAFTYCTYGQVCWRFRGPEARCAGVSPRTCHDGAFHSGARRHDRLAPSRNRAVAQSRARRASPASLAHGTESHCTSHASSGAGTLVPVEGGTRRPDVL